MEKWKLISSKYYYKSPFGNLRCDRVALPNGRVIEEYNVCEYTDWVNMVAVTEEGQVLLVRQYRHALGEITLEVPAGSPEPGETMAEAAKRELAEETGYTSPNEPVLLGKYATNPARNNNYIWYFLFTGCRKTGATHFDANEELELETASFAEIEKMISSGEIYQQSTVLAIERARRTLGI